MFDANFFELPIELQLKLRVISDDIEKCTDVKQLQSNLKDCHSLLLTYMNMTNKLLKKQLHTELSDITDKIGKD